MGFIKYIGQVTRERSWESLVVYVVPFLVVHLLSGHFGMPQLVETLMFGASITIALIGALSVIGDALLLNLKSQAALFQKQLRNQSW